MQLTNYDFTKIAAESGLSVPTVRAYLNPDNPRKTTVANARAVKAAMLKLGYAHGPVPFAGGSIEST